MVAVYVGELCCRQRVPRTDGVDREARVRVAMPAVTVVAPPPPGPPRLGWSLWLSVLPCLGFIGRLDIPVSILEGDLHRCVRDGCPSHRGGRLHDELRSACSTVRL